MESQVRDGVGLDQDDDGRGGEKWLELGIFCR